MGADPRWPRKQIILTTLVLQLIFAAIVMAMGLHGYLSVIHAIFPVPVAGLTALSVVVHLICFANASMHPLVVLTLSIQFMILWLGVVIFEGIFWAYGDERCGERGLSSVYWKTPDEYDSYSYYSRSVAFNRATHSTVCQRYVVSLVFSIFSFLSYVFLITYSAIRRKRTVMPYVVPQKVSALSTSAAYNPDTYRNPTQQQPMMQTAPAVTQPQQTSAAAGPSGTAVV